ncbi:MAG: hypothetical protein WD341_20800 [Tistlia sp.]|uniref:hypothetical protein n=1 Tax=Tistlia sp. TaxID=3057121 RepID=UPI0034A2430B
MRRVLAGAMLACWALAFGALALPSGPAAAATPESGPLEQVRAALYHALMAEILGTGIETASEGAARSIGPVNPYPSIQADKVVAACINWENSSLGAVEWHGYAYYYDSAQSRPQDDPEQLVKLEARAKEHCRQYEAAADCYCRTVDVNERNALELPAWFVEAHLSGHARR